MTDRKLLELAAKAAGYRLQIADTGYIAWNGAKPFNWNPLTDDGDALSLAVKLGIVIDPYHGLVMVHDMDFGISPNDIKATRRAIVLAAAEIGRKMK